MASAGPAEEEEAAAAAREEQALRKLVVRLQNVQERKRLETLVQTLSDLLELAARQSGKGRPPCPALPGPVRPGPPHTPLTRLFCVPPLPAPRLFSGKNIHVPVLLVVDMYAGAAGVQQVSGPEPPPALPGGCVKENAAPLQKDRTRLGAGSPRFLQMRAAALKGKRKWSDERKRSGVDAA